MYDADTSSTESYAQKCIIHRNLPIVCKMPRKGGAKDEEKKKAFKNILQLQIHIST